MYISFFLSSQFGIDPSFRCWSEPVLFVCGVLIQHT